MKLNPFVAALLLSATAPAWALCSYPLDATQAQVAALQGGQTYTGVPVVNGQTMEFTVVGTPTVTVFGATSDTGAQAILQGESTNLPSGDLPLPPSGRMHVRMRLNSYPWAPLSGPYSTVWQAVGVTTGNTATPLPKDSLQLSLVAVNSSAAGTQNGQRTFLGVSGQSISGNTVSTAYKELPFDGPLPADVVGLWIDMDTRQMGVSFHIIDGNAYGIAAGDYDLDPLDDSQGNPYVVPAGVNSVSLMMLGLLARIPATDPQIGTAVSATLETDYCGPTGPAPLKLPNARLFPGNGKANPPGLQKFQSLALPLKPLGQYVKPQH